MNVLEMSRLKGVLANFVVFLVHFLFFLLARRVYIAARSH